MKKTVTQQEPENDESLSHEEVRELKRRIKDADDPIRYMIVSRIMSKWKLWFNSSTDTYCDQIETGTLFKRKAYAESLLRILRDGRNDKTILVAKVTTKQKTIRVLKYYT